MIDYFRRVVKNVSDIMSTLSAAYRDQKLVGSCLILIQIKVELINAMLVLGQTVFIGNADDRKNTLILFYATLKFAKVRLYEFIRQYQHTLLIYLVFSSIFWHVM